MPQLTEKLQSKASKSKDTDASRIDQGLATARTTMGKVPVSPVEAIVTASLGWIFMSISRTLRRKQRRLDQACVELDAAKAQLAEKEAALVRATQEAEEHKAALEAEREKGHLTAAQEVALANARCHEAAAQLERTMGDLQQTESQLLAARQELQDALNALQDARSRGEAAEGELGLTKSENELLKRELHRMRSQLDGATERLQRHRASAGMRRDTIAGREGGGGFLGSAWQDEESGWSAEGELSD